MFHVTAFLAGAFIAAAAGMASGNFEVGAFAGAGALLFLGSARLGITDAIVEANRRLGRTP
mgnify:CR=1 FL=1